MTAPSRWIPIVLLALAGPGLLACQGSRERAEGLRLYNEGIRTPAGASDSAYSLFRRATRLDPGNHRAYYEMALIDIYDRGERGHGLTLLETAEKIQPRDRDVLYQLGRTLIAAGELNRGHRYLERALEADPNYAPAWYQKGAVLRAQGQHEGADDAFREAIAIDPRYSPAFRDLGEMYEDVDAWEAAQAVYEEGLRHASDDPDLLNALGLLALRRGEPARAVEHFERAKGLSEARLDTLFNLAFAHIEAGNHGEAFRNLGEYLNAVPETEKEHIQVALALRDAVIKEIQRQRAEDGP